MPENYPLLFCELADDGSEVKENTDAFYLNFLVLDIPNKASKEVSLREALSDTRAIAKDMIAFFRYTKFDSPLTIDLPVILNDQVDILDDEASGWSFKLKLRTTDGLDLCSIPASGYTPPIDYNKVRIRDVETGEVLYRIPAGQDFFIEQLREILDTIDTNTVTIIDPLT